jgi:hypothetical protein
MTRYHDVTQLTKAELERLRRDPVPCLDDFEDPQEIPERGTPPR